MKLLREYIRELLTEAAAGVNELVENDVYITISKERAGKGYQIHYSDKNGEFNDSRVKDIYGEVTVGIHDKETGPCDGAWTVVYSNATRGWGPLLYDVAMEYATEIGGGLTPDRSAVSSDAENVWKYYFNKRGDVKSHQLDLDDNSVKNAQHWAHSDDPLPLEKLTPGIEEDDCSQERTIRAHASEWSDSPLSKRYTKAPTTINALRAAGRLIEEER